MSIYGGKIEEIPLPHRRKSETPGEKRRVTITLTSYVGSWFGKHVYVGFRVEGDAIWNSERDDWQIPWEDLAGEYRFPDGADVHKKFNSEENAMKFAKEIVKKYFPSDKFKIEFMGLTEEEEKLLRKAVRPEGD